MLNILKNILNNQLYAISLYVRNIAGTVILFIIAHYLSVYDYGLFSSYKNIASFFLIFANLGFSEYILVSSNADTKRVRLKISLFITNALTIVFLMGLGGFCTGLQNAFLFLLIVIRTFFDTTFFALILPYFQSAKEFNKIAVINIIYALCIMFVALFSYIFKLSLVKFLILNIIIGTINFLQCSYQAKINYFIFIKNFKRFLSLIDKKIFAYMGANLSSYLYGQLPALYVSTYIQKEQAALFFSGFTIASIVYLIINAQCQKMLPEMIKADLDQIKAILKKNLVFMLSITFGFFVLMILIGKIILRLLYGNIYYINAYPILLIQMLGNIAVAEAAVFGTYITASGNQRKKIPMQLEATAVAVIGLFILHRYGIYGAASSFLIAAIYIGLRYTLKTKQLLKYKYNEIS